MVGARSGTVGRDLLAQGHPRYVCLVHPAEAQLGGRRGFAVHAFGCRGTCGGRRLMRALEDALQGAQLRVSGDTGVGGLCLYEFSHQLHFSGVRAPSSLEGSLRVAGLCG